MGLYDFVLILSFIAGSVFLFAWAVRYEYGLRTEELKRSGSRPYVWWESTETVTPTKENAERRQDAEDRHDIP